MSKHKLTIRDSEMTKLCRAVLWYCENVAITDTKLMSQVTCLHEHLTNAARIKDFGFEKVGFLVCEGR